jgi:uncharacterized protein
MKTMIFARTLLLGLALSLCGVLPAAVSAQELAPEHLAMARKFVDLTDKAAVYEVALVQVGIDSMRTLLAQNPDKFDVVDQAITKTLDAYKARKGELMDQFARVYAQRLTMEELQAIVEFYGSPVGQKLADVQADANDDLQTVMSLFSINLRTEFFAEVRAELRTAGLTL